MKIILNGKFLSQRMTGVQRYAINVSSRLNYRVLEKHKKIPALFWEQFFLPIKTYGKLLFSPCNVGPVLKSKQVVTIHDAAFFDHPEWFSKKFSFIYKLLIPVLAKRCRHIITVSHFSKERLLFHLNIPEDKISVVYNGVSDVYFKKEYIPHPVTREKFQIGNDKIILSVGSVDPRKNIPRLIRAWNKIPKNIRSGWKLVLAGGRSKNFAAVDNIQETVDIKFLDYVSDAELHALYSLADIFAYPSLYEGFGLPPLEAMACNTAVLTSNISSLPEVVGDAAYLIDPHDEEKILQGLTELMSSEALRDDLAMKGLIQSKKFSWDKCAKEVNDILMRFK